MTEPLFTVSPHGSLQLGGGAGGRLLARRVPLASSLPFRGQIPTRHPDPTSDPDIPSSILLRPRGPSRGPSPVQTLCGKEGK